MRDHILIAYIYTQYGKKLQAVLKQDLRRVEWSDFEVKQKVRKTIEGAIAKKRNVECLIDTPMKILVSRGSFQGPNEEWKKVSKSISPPFLFLKQSPLRACCCFGETQCCIYQHKGIS